MRSLNRVSKFLMVVGGSAVLFSGSCVPDNLWAGIWGATIIDGTVGYLRDLVLGIVLPTA